MHPILSRATDRRGAALPVALMGLVAITLLVTAALFTSSTEFAISSAHRTAAESLFGADAALEQFVADETVLQRMAVTEGNPAVIDAPDGNTYLVRVARLRDKRDLDADPVRRDETFSILVEPQSGRGRGVGAFVNTVRSANKFDTNIQAGATSGGDLKVSGNATISDGRSGTNYCAAADSTADYAVQVTAGSKIELGQNATKKLEGATDTADFTKEQLAENVLGPNTTLRSLAENAQIKFGHTWSKPAFVTKVINSDSSATGYDPRYDWGCPASLGVTCPRVSSTNRHVVVAIDANGGTVKLNGRYGQGMIIVINGSLEIQGNFTYKGIILVERDMFIRGGSAGNEAKIEGSVISFGASSTVEDNISGTATIKYNTCAIADAERALNGNVLESAPQSRNGVTYSWYELIR